MRAWIAVFCLMFGLGHGGAPPARAQAPAQDVQQSAWVAAINRQGALWEAAAAGLAPQRPGITDVYVISVAADGETDVFLSEATKAAAILAERFDARDVLLLSNDPATWERAPLANTRAVARAIELVGGIMDRSQDVLVVFITAHGLPAGVVFANPATPAKSVLEPRALAQMLAEHGPAHRIAIVSACYSGVFVKPLQGPTAAVITAARADRVSFGCQAQREWTYFGDAFFANGMRQADDLEGAFARAAELVTDWEKRDGLAPPSEPQLAMGAALRAKLATAPWGAIHHSGE